MHALQVKMGNPHAIAVIRVYHDVQYRRWKTVVFLQERTHHGLPSLLSSTASEHIGIQSIRI